MPSPILLSVGATNTLTQNVVYELPARACFIFANAALEASLDNSTYVLVTASTTGTTIIQPFIRCTTGAAIVSLKGY